MVPENSSGDRNQRENRALVADGAGETTRFCGAKGGMGDVTEMKSRKTVNIEISGTERGNAGHSGRYGQACWIT